MHMNIRDKSLRALLVQLLVSLKNFYTFKDLEQILGVPQHTLWKYTSLNMMPEEQTAKRIFDKILSTKTVERIVMNQLNLAGNDNKWIYLWNPALMDLISFIVYRYFTKDAFDHILCFPEIAIPLGMSISRWYRKKLCVACNYSIFRSSNYIIEFYLDKDRFPKMLYIPRNCISKNGKILLVTDDILEGSILMSVNNIIKRIPAKIIGLITIECSPTAYQFIKSNYHYPVLVVKDIVTSSLKSS